MMHPKHKNATTKCRVGCTLYNLCAPCLNFRKTFKVGQIITWGSCTSDFKILEVNKDNIIVSMYDRKHYVSYNDLNLKIVRLK